MSIRIYFPMKIQDTGDEITLVKSKRTGKCLWWNKTKGMFYVCNTPFMRELQQIAESEVKNEIHS